MRFISTLNNGKCFILRDLFILNYWPIIKTLKKLIVICGRNIKYSKLFEYWTRSTFTFNVSLKPWIRVTTQKIATCCCFFFYMVSFITIRSPCLYVWVPHRRSRRIFFIPAMKRMCSDFMFRFITIY